MRAERMLLKFSNALSAFCFLPYVLRTKASGASFGLVGRTGTVLRSLAPEGAILVCGEIWRARTRNGEKIVRGSRVRIIGAHKHLLEVAQIEDGDKD